MDKTLIIQSHRSPLPYSWLNACLDSVRIWSEQYKFEYRFFGDELFDLVAENIIQKTQSQKVIRSDIARLLLIRKSLNEGFSRVVWLDADFLVFAPDEFILPNKPYAIGREVWVQLDNKRKLRVYKKVHNAFLMFCRGNSFLDFYIETAQKLVIQNQGLMPPQFIGPKLLTALHNISILEVMEKAGMLSPLVIKDCINGEGNALNLFRKNSPQSVSGANLCCSSIKNGQVSISEMESLIKSLMSSSAFFA